MRRETEIWWKQSEEDLISAEKNFEIERYYVTVFLCQQCIEKGLKALFFKIKNTNPGQTHSLLFLAKETKVPEKFNKFLRRLTPQFINTRYPDAAYDSPSEIYDKELTDEYLKETKELMIWLKLQINK